MWIIDRYLLRQFLQTFFICLLSLTGLYIVFDAFTNLECFLRGAEKQGGLFHVMAPYYACRALLFFDRTSGLLTLTAAMFTVAWIQRHNELVALMAAGLSRIRVVMPIVLAALAIVVVATANRELAIPRFRSELARRPQDIAGDASKELSPQYDQQTDILIRGKAAFADRQRIEAPCFRLLPPLDYYARQIEAREAFYHPPQGERPGGYLMAGVVQPKGLAEKPSLMFKDRPVVITPKDAPDWLKADECFVATDVTFEQLTHPQAWRDFSSTAQLIRGLHNRSLDFGGNVRVAIHARIVQPLLDATLLFLGLPMVLARSDRNVFFALLLCGLLSLGFMLVVIALQYLGSTYGFAALSVWAPLMIFVPVAVELVCSVNRH